MQQGSFFYRRPSLGSQILDSHSHSLTRGLNADHRRSACTPSALGPSEYRKIQPGDPLVRRREDFRHGYAAYRDSGAEQRSRRMARYSQSRNSVERQWLITGVQGETPSAVNSCDFRESGQLTIFGAEKLGVCRNFLRTKNQKTDTYHLSFRSKNSSQLGSPLIIFLFGLKAPHTERPSPIFSWASIKSAG